MTKGFGTGRVQDSTWDLETFMSIVDGTGVTTLVGQGGGRGGGLEDLMVYFREERVMIM